MFDYAIWLVALMAAVSGMGLPKALSQQPWIVFPSHHLAEPTNNTLLPAPVFRTYPERVDADAGPQLEAKAGIVMDAESGMVLWEKDADALLPIASITKLFTAVTAEQHITNWDEPYTLQYSDIAVGGSQFGGGTGDVFSKRDLLKAALVGSINQAAQAVAHSTGLSDEEFTKAMNATAEQLGLTSSEFTEPTGLSSRNRSTAREIALLLRTISKHDLLLEPMTQSEHKMANEAKELTIKTTNDLVRDQAAHIVAGKTGFTDEAGNCLATIAETEEGQRLFIVVLGAPNDTSRFRETTELFDWTTEHYRWPSQ